MYCYYRLISCLLCFSGLVLASSSPNSSDLDRQYDDHEARVEGNLDARSGPSKSYYDDGNVSKRRKRALSYPITNRRDVDTPVCSPLKQIYSHRGPMIPMIEAFCTEAAKQGVKDNNSGAITRQYNKVDMNEDPGGTPSYPGYEDWEDEVDDDEYLGGTASFASYDDGGGIISEVRFAIEILDDTLKPEKDECKRVFMVLTEDCPSAEDKHPRNLKAGGTMNTEGFKYRLEPLGTSGTGLTTLDRRLARAPRSFDR